MTKSWIALNEEVEDDFNMILMCFSTYSVGVRNKYLYWSELTLS